MREPAFWWQGKNGGRLLAPVAGIYGAFAAMRLRSPGQKVGIPIICVGNLTVGGAGKTPAALTVGRLLLAENKRPFFLTRGYGGRLVGPVRVDRAIHGAADVGDEPLLLAELAPTIVARDRLAGARAAQRDGADAIVMDDGFQNPSLAKDLAILVVDGRRAIGNGRVFPAGPLRAPLEAQLARAHAVLV
ncbi:MAG: tetraacyldisaccharide 4'-kinase, partial [Xanthobacteraceae bacterium]